MAVQWRKMCHNANARILIAHAINKRVDQGLMTPSKSSLPLLAHARIVPLHISDWIGRRLELAAGRTPRI